MRKDKRKPPKGTVLLGGFYYLYKIKKCSIYAALSPIKPPIGTVPFVDLNVTIAEKRTRECEKSEDKRF